MKPGEQKEKRPEPERKLIKFDTPEKPVEKKDIPPQDPLKKTISNPDSIKITNDKIPGASADASREELEQRRTILQNMKDFDFQIKKNQEDITSIHQKVESLSKDLDDLVSLYEIVSEQMNPFVGLSKVTKKRLDALENIIKEVDGVKTRVGDLESNLEKNGVSIKNNQPPTEQKSPTETQGKQGEVLTVTAPLNIPETHTVRISASSVETLNDNDLDIVLTKSLESLLMEQNIDTMINDFFINLK